MYPLCNSHGGAGTCTRSVTATGERVHAGTCTRSVTATGGRVHGGFTWGAGEGTDGAHERSPVPAGLRTDTNGHGKKHKVKLKGQQQIVNE